MFSYLLYATGPFSRALDARLHWLVDVGAYGARATLSAYGGGALPFTQTTSPQPSRANPPPEVVTAMHDHATYVSGNHSPGSGAFKNKKKRNTILR